VVKSRSIFNCDILGVYLFICTADENGIALGQYTKLPLIITCTLCVVFSLTLFV